MSTSLLHVAEGLFPVTLPDNADLPSVTADAIDIRSGLHYGSFWVRATAEDGTIRLKAMHGNGVILSEATFTHIPASIITDALVALCWYAAEEVAA